MAWGGTTDPELSKSILHKKRAIRALTGLNYCESCKEAFRKHKILKVLSLCSYILEIMYVVSSNQTTMTDRL
ncbi:hypothetical protein J6590_013879 [Homalodisca vitripennis]|nr:hypothetical protein J6590_013879 [Homalodisca vitripennis]